MRQTGTRRGVGTLAKIGHPIILGFLSFFLLFFTMFSRFLLNKIIFSDTNIPQCNVPWVFILTPILHVPLQKWEKIANFLNLL